MFQLAICGGSLAVPQDLVARKQPAKAAAKPATHEPALALPSEGAVKQFLKDRGSGGAELQGCGFRPSRQDVFEFMKQCGPFTSTEPDAVSH
ncbi:hypothetical protein CRUP_001621 [Coryphaenoides rupestris]|nr:hypothetical protein CRUP_001621 [Coryphaenoides rupestris]